MFSTETSPTKSPKYTRRRVASLGLSSKDIMSYMQLEKSGKRKEQERSPENKIETAVKKKFSEKTKMKRNMGLEEDRHIEQEQSEENQQKDMKDIEELRKLIGSMHEDMKTMEGKMMGRMDSLLKELKTENEGRAEGMDKRITNLVINER
ncbi:hypothetical protein QAD02_007988 [Eretmocerus hayati]|uniref:Uncharacterized protein n=1 Tax=Eretmocerus hayati TaxID=131215 RepID=A0ACC2N6M0_9HYME|nr:hypothetical protein QAD02_007988 [Eretmocerus hayati]